MTPVTPAHDPDNEPTVIEPISCPICGARYTFRDLVSGHRHQFPPKPQPRTINMKIVTLTLAIAATLLATAAYGADKPAPALTKVAVCKDGKTYSHPTGERRGACSGHGGVETWADGTAPKSHGNRGKYE